MAFKKKNPLIHLTQSLVSTVRRNERIEPRSKNIEAHSESHRPRSPPLKLSKKREGTLVIAPKYDGFQ